MHTSQFYLAFLFFFTYFELHAEVSQISFQQIHPFVLELKATPKDANENYFQVATVGDSLMHNFHAAPTLGLLAQIMNPQPQGAIMDTSPSPNSTFSYMERLTELKPTQLVNLAVAGAQVMKSENAVLFSIPSLNDQIDNLLKLKNFEADLILIWIGHNDIAASFFAANKEEFYKTFKSKYTQALSKLNNSKRSKKLKILCLSLGSAEMLFAARNECLLKKQNEDTSLYPNFYDARNTCKALEDNFHVEAALAVERLNEMIKDAVNSIEAEDQVDITFSDEIQKAGPLSFEDLSPLDAFHPSVKGQNRIAETLFKISINSL